MKPSTCPQPPPSACASPPPSSPAAAGSDGGRSPSGGGTATSSTAARSPWRSPATPATSTRRSAPAAQLFTVTQLAYDNLVSRRRQDRRDRVAALATKWTVDGKTVTFTLAEGITCADGSDFTATDRRRQHQLRRRPGEQEPVPRHLPPGGRHRQGRRRRRHRDAHARRSPRRSSSTASASLPMVCAAGHDGPQALAAGTDGTGPYELTEAAPGDHYTYTIRDGYTWGPNGATTADEGHARHRRHEGHRERGHRRQPAALRRASTPPRSRARTPSASTAAGAVRPPRRPPWSGEQWYNHADGRRDQRPARADGAHPGARPRASSRRSLTVRQGHAGHHARGDRADLLPRRLRSLAAARRPRTSDAGQGRRCAAARSSTFLYSSAAGSAVAAAAELAVQEWKAAGADVTAQGRRRDRAPGRDLRRRRLGHRLGPAQRQQPRPAGAVPVRRRPGRRRHQLLRASTTRTTPPA